MTSISANPYVTRYTNSLVNARQQAQANKTPTATDTASSATMVTLSDAAKAALSDKTFETVIADARTHMKELLTDTGRTSLLENDQLAVDLSQFDRRELFAISSNADGNFSQDETTAAAQELQRRFDTALAGPTAVARVTGDITPLYNSALEYLDSMSAEEKATDTWQNQKAAVKEMLTQLDSDPDNIPLDIANDPVLDYIDRLTKGESGDLRDFADVTRDTRTALDRQYEANGQPPGQFIDLSNFNGQALSAIALNNDDQFTSREVQAAKLEVNSRSGNAVRAAYESSARSNDPAALAKNLIAQYGSMTAEERQAAGWSEDFYSTIVSHYETSVRISEMFSSTTSSDGRSGLLSLL